MQIAAGLVIGGLTALDGEQVFLDLNGKVFGFETGDRDLDAIGVLVRAFVVAADSRSWARRSIPTTER
jgi:hypothetical protein